MTLRIYFRRRTELAPIEFDVALQPGSKDPPYAAGFAKKTEEELRNALTENGADFVPTGKPLRHCANIEYRLRIHKREGVYFWSDPIVTCDPTDRVATANVANFIRETFAAAEPR